MSNQPPTEPPKPKSCLRPGFGGALIVMLIFAAYWPALRGQFVWDDLLIVTNNPLVTGQASLSSIWFHEDFPLTTVVLWAEWLCWGKNPTGYHVVNVLLHALSCLLLWRVLARLKIPGAWLAAAIFAVHPVCVPSVAWISELKNALSLPFFLLSLGCYLKFESVSAVARRTGESQLKNSSTPRANPPSPPSAAGESRGEEARSAVTYETPLPVQRGEGVPSTLAKANLWYWLALGAFLLALLSKTSTVMLPVVLLGCAWWQRGILTRRDCWRVAPFFALALMFGGMTVWFQAHQAMAGVPVQSENFWARLAGAGWALWFYLGKAIMPLNLNLIYPRWEINATAPAAWLPLFLWVAVIAGCWKFRSGWGRSALFALGFFAVNLFPALGFFDMYFLAISRVSDHFQYVSLIAVAAVTGAALSALPFGALRGIAPALLLTLALLTAHRARTFATEEGLWTDVLQKNPNAWPAHNNLGCIRAEHQDLVGAMQHFTASLEVNPRNAGAHANLGKALSLQNRFAEAEPHFRAALEIKPEHVDTLKAYGAALAAQGRLDEAVHHLSEAVRLKPDTDTRLQLASLLAATGHPREAVTQCRAVLVLELNSTIALNNLAWLLATSSDATVRDGAEAVRCAEQACRLTGEQEAVMLGTLAAAYAEAGRFADAVATAQKAIALAQASGNPGFANANQQLLRLYQAGRPYHEPERKR